MMPPKEIGPHVVSERQQAAFRAVLADTEWAARFRQRFFARVHPEPMSGCHLWGAANKSGGYGFQTACMPFGKVPLMAHRLAMAFDSGFLPDGHTVNHRCDNPSCVNPRHLYAGTQRDNVADAVRAGAFRENWRNSRWAKPPPVLHGEANGMFGRPHPRRGSSR